MTFTYAFIHYANIEKTSNSNVVTKSTYIQDWPLNSRYDFSIHA